MFLCDVIVISISLQVKYAESLVMMSGLFAIKVLSSSSYYYYLLLLPRNQIEGLALVEYQKVTNFLGIHCHKEMRVNFTFPFCHRS